MGYDLHITRADSWLDSNRVPISPEEWLEVVDADPELKLAGYNGEYFTLWSGSSRHEEPWFNWWEGNVETKNPDPPIIAKMIRLATQLGAKVQGDDEEIYLAGGRVTRDGEVQDYKWTDEY